MALTEQQKDNLKHNLVELELMSENDDILETVQGDVYKSFLSGQCRGHYYFTNEGIVFLSGWGANSFSIKYSNIKEIKKSLTPPCFPFGVTITFVDSANGKTHKYKLSLLKRNYWFDYISSKAGATC